MVNVLEFTIILEKIIPKLKWRCCRVGGGGGGVEEKTIEIVRSRKRKKGKEGNNPNLQGK